MRSIRNKAKQIEKPDTYPCLKRSKAPSTHVHGGDYVVLFIAPEEGVVVNTDGACTYSIGHYSKNWAEKHSFNLFDDVIELQND